MLQDRMRHACYVAGQNEVACYVAGQNEACLLCCSSIPVPTNVSHASPPKFTLQEHRPRLLHC